MTWTPESGCIGKQTYLDKRHAKSMCRAVNGKNAHRGQPLAHVYRCPCGYWHIGRPIGLRSQEDHAA